MVSIIAVHQSGFNILLRDSENYLHLVGNNSHDLTLIEAFNNSSFKLADNESVLKFKSDSKGLIIYTSHQKLFILYHKQPNQNLIEYPFPNTTPCEKLDSECYSYKLSAQQLLALDFKCNISPRASMMSMSASIRKMFFNNIGAVVIGKNITIFINNNRIFVHEFIYHPDKKSTQHNSIPLIRCLFMHNCYDTRTSIACRTSIARKDYIVTSDLLCIRDGTSYHVILPEITNAGIKYINFEWKLIIKKDQIFWNKINECLYVKDGVKNIYFYNLKSQQLELLLDSQTEYLFSRSLFNTSLYKRDLTSISRIPSSNNDFWNFPEMTNISNINYVYNRSGFDTLIVLHRDVNTSFSYRRHDKITIINTSGLKYYGVVNDRFAYILDGKFNILNTNTNELALKSVTLPCAESSITKSFINITVTIETVDAIYYSYLFDASNQFRFIHLSRTIKSHITPGISTLEFINYDYKLILTRDRGESFHINHHQFVIDVFLEEISKVNPHGDHSVYFGTRMHWATGNGALRMAITFVLNAFAAKYLITHNFTTSLNIDILSKCSDTQLLNMGRFLLFCYNLTNCLAIRLPLLLIVAIQRRLPTIAALEFFAKNEDNEAYNHLLKIRHSELELAEAGFDDYIDGLNFISKFNVQYGSNMCTDYTIAKKIADGFLSSIKYSGFFETNLATFDFWLSGDYHIDIKSFLLTVYFGNLTTAAQRCIITSYIESLTQQQFRRLLINWSGTSVIKSSFSYQIYVCKKGNINVHFVACFTTIYIIESLFDEVPIEEWHTIFLDECMHADG